jgi:enoyl-CoA hydratase
MQQSPEQSITLERDGRVLRIGLNRPQKRNAFTLAMLAELSRAYAELESDDELRAGMLFAHGEHFTGGLDLVDVGPALATGKSPYPDDGETPGGPTAPGRSRSSPQRKVG